MILIIIELPHPSPSPDFPKPGISPHLGKDVVAPDIPGEQGKETLPTVGILTEITSVPVGTGSGFPAAAGVQEISRSSVVHTCVHESLCRVVTHGAGYCRQG